MKKFLFVALFVLAAFSLPAHSQVTVNVSIQPDWGPAGYNHVDYYYLPDIDVYYYVPSKQYVYLSDNHWVWRNNLPARYQGYDLYNSYKVVMNTKAPYVNHSAHVKKYADYKNKNGVQKSLRDSRTSKQVGSASQNNRNTPAMSNRNNSNKNQRNKGGKEQSTQKRHKNVR